MTRTPPMLSRLFGRPMKEAALRRRIARLRAEVAIFHEKDSLPSTVGAFSLDDDLDTIEQALNAAREDAARATLLAGAVARSVHDMRGALSPALLTAERLQDNADPAVSRAGDLVLRIVERCSEVMETLVAVARAERPPMVRERLALRPLIDAADQRARQLHPDLRIETAVLDDVTVTLAGGILKLALTHLFAGAAHAGARRIDARTDATAGPLTLVLVPDKTPPDPRHVAIATDLLRATGGDAALSDSGMIRLTLPYAQQAPRP